MSMTCGMIIGSATMLTCGLTWRNGRFSYHYDKLINQGRSSYLGWENLVHLFYMIVGYNLRTMRPVEKLVDQE
jgi:hypothetical protein